MMFLFTLKINTQQKPHEMTKIIQNFLKEMQDNTEKKLSNVKKTPGLDKVERKKFLIKQSVMFQFQFLMFMSFSFHCSRYTMQKDRSPCSGFTTYKVKILEKISG